ncbi:MAG: ABC transporter permease [Betaproteobacteria bacterium]|nr:ABC transporter permease [Betaproteobacteria bacterium]
MLFPLASDYLVWLLVAALASFAYYCSRNPHLAAPWARVFRSRAAVASAVVLAFFVGVGLLDSVHYRPRLPATDPAAPPVYSVEVRSLLDLALTRLRTRLEITYSAPLATRLLQKERIERPDGTSVRDYPRLRFGGQHLKDEADLSQDVALRIVAGLALAAAVWSLVVLAGRRTLARRWPFVPWDAAAIALAALLALAGPVAMLAAGYHVLGTNQVGSDVLYQALKSIRISLVIGTLTTLVLLPLGIAAGITAGYFKGWLDDAVQYVYTTLNSIPGVLLIAASVLMVQVYIDTHPELFPTSAQRADFRLLSLCAILGAVDWTGLARLLRGETLKLAQLDYIEAAHAFGVSHVRILTRHILPNVTHIVVITLVLSFSGLVLAEAVLSYIGVGVDPSTISFGTMINAARLEMAREPMVWWSLAAAFVFMFALVLAANLFADAVRDGFDPRVRV